MKNLSQMNEIELKYEKNSILSQKITNHKDAVKYVRAMYDENTIEAYESFYCLFLDDEFNPINYIQIGKGGITATVVDVRLVFASMLKSNATKIILSHNHPSGGLVFSKADHNITDVIQKCCDFLDFVVLDHILITRDSYEAMKAFV